MNSLKLVIVTCVLALVGCAQQTRVDPRAGGTVTVTVTADRDIVVNVEPIHVRARDVVLMWKLVSETGDEYRFIDDRGIEILYATDDQYSKLLNPTPALLSEFVECKAVAQGSMFQCKDKNSTLGSERYYKYKIAVRNVRTGQELKLDPWINNH